MQRIPKEFAVTHFWKCILFFKFEPDSGAELFMKLSCVVLSYTILIFKGIVDTLWHS